MNDSYEISRLADKKLGQKQPFFILWTKSFSILPRNREKNENHFKISRCAKSCLDKNLWGYVWILILLNHGQVWPEKNTIMFGLVRKMFVCVRYVMKCSHRVLEFLRVLLTEFNCVRFLNIKHQYHVICQKKSSNCRQSSLGYYVRIYRKCKVYFFFHRFVSKSKTVLEWSF